MNPANIVGTHFTFRWEKMPYRIPGEFCDMPDGRLSVKRQAAHARIFDVRWNAIGSGKARHVGSSDTPEKAKSLAEQLYMEGKL